VTTKAEFRDLLRRTLEDTSLSAPLWSDDALDDAMAEALARYGAIVPLETRSTITVSDGDGQITVSGLESAAWIASIRDAAGRLIEPMVDDRLPAQGWRWWNGAIELARPAVGGTWTIDWRAPRLLPALDAHDLPIRSGDDFAVCLFAAATALRRRAVEEAKRTGRGDESLLALARHYDADGERLARHRHRRVQGSFARKE
jgi:hypothetical protein